jgi:hypothetical protein
MKNLTQAEKLLLRTWVTQNQTNLVRKIDYSFAFLCTMFATVLSMPIVVAIAHGGSIHL